MSYYDQLMGLSGLYYCAECRGFHAPEPSSYPPRRGGSYGPRSGYPSPTSPYPPRRKPAKFRDPWGGQDPYADAIEVAGPDNGRYPTYSEPARPVRRPPPRRSPPAARPRSPPQDYGGRAPGRGAVSGAGGGPVYADGDIPAIPKLPPVDPRKRIRPKNPNETFLNPAVLRGRGRHPFVEGFPRESRGGRVRVEEMTLEEQSARAFVMTCLHGVEWPDVAEDMYDLAKRGKVPAKLVEHIKYFMGAVLPHLSAKGEMTPGDYCKVRKCIDWMADVGGVWGSAMNWSDGFGKRDGHAREGGWWRKERIGFPDGNGFAADMI